MTTLYIAGPMTGLPEFNYPAFFEAEARLITAGYATLNPARHGADPAQTWADCMRVGIRDVTAADGVAVLPGWMNSTGARIEVRIAWDLGIPVQPVSEWEVSS
jgi:uncharacterized protein DUF4406